MTDHTPEPRKGRIRQIVKRIALTVAGTVLLLTSYIACWCWREWRMAQRAGPPRRNPIVDDLFAPLDMLADSTLPLGDHLYTLRMCAKDGRYFWTSDRYPWAYAEAMMHLEKYKDHAPLTEYQRSRRAMLLRDETPGDAAGANGGTADEGAVTTPPAPANP